MANRKRIAIVGAGPSGLAAAKSCLEENLEPVVFERADDLGGLWRYHEDDVEGLASVMRTTIINSSKELSAFSDFPPPEEFPNFMHHSMMLKYFQLYADKFGLRKYIHYKQEIVQIRQAEDYDETGRWNVRVKNLTSGQETCDVYDGVMICIGHHCYPNVPTFRGQDKFKGTVTHTHSLKTVDKYKDRRVAVIGLGNSGVDAAVDASHLATKVFLSTRRGSWVISRVGPNGLPVDSIALRRYIQYLAWYLPYGYKCSLVEKTCNERFDHSLYGLRPKHRYFAQHPTINDHLANRILSGTVVIKGDVREFTETGIIFEGDTDITKVDDVVLATGYRICFPFLSASVVPIEDNRVQLYKYVFPPQLKHPSLAIIGQIQPLGSIFPIAEMHCRWYARLMNGHVKLPSYDAMMQDIDKKYAEVRNRYVASPRHTIQVDYMDYMDELAEVIEVKPDMLGLFLTDRKLFWKLFRGPFVPYQYRLTGPHAWSNARETIINTMDRIKAPLKTRNDFEYKRYTTRKKNERALMKLLFTVLFFFIVVPLLLSYCLK